MYEQENYKIGSAVIKVVGVGGGGCNAINSMISSNVGSAEFIAVNTDSQALLMSKAEKTLQIGAKLTKGLGAGSDPSVGEAAAEESKDEIAALLQGTDLLFIACGEGGGTGTGAASVIARIASDMQILTVAVVTKPFSFEGRVRNANANSGIANLRKYVDTLVVIPNDKLLQYLPPHVGVLDAFKVADDMLKQGIVSIVELIATPSLINLDFADVNTVMRHQGLAHMGLGRAKGENRIIESVRQAVSSPLLETTIEGAKSVILSVTGGRDLELNEVSEAALLVQGIIDPNANIIFGATIDENMSEEVKITIIATGFDEVKDNPEPLEVKPVLKYESMPTEEPKPIATEEKQVRSVEEFLTMTAPRQTVDVEETVDAKPVINDVQTQKTADEADEPVKSRELPAFMKKLFGKK